jgi:hypothetical protein
VTRRHGDFGQRRPGSEIGTGMSRPASDEPPTIGMQNPTLPIGVRLPPPDTAEDLSVPRYVWRLAPGCLLTAPLR